MLGRVLRFFPQLFGLGKSGIDFCRLIGFQSVVGRLLFHDFQTVEDDEHASGKRQHNLNGLDVPGIKFRRGGRKE